MDSSSDALEALDRRRLPPVALLAPKLKIPRGVRPALAERDDVVELQILARAAVDTSALIAPPDLVADGLRDRRSSYNLRGVGRRAPERIGPCPLQGCLLLLVALEDESLHVVGRQALAVPPEPPREPPPNSSLPRS